ncbi:MAG: DUF2851 family protein [Balneolaceae bacterium]
MAETDFQHSEAFLQWIWENLLFDFTSLSTTCGKPITIADKGRLNKSDGPDFKRASIQIDGISWHGDVEIHTKAKNWEYHGHQNDENFNSVILHVVADHEASAIFCQNNSSPFTLNLLPYLSKELHLFLKSFEQPSNLPCSSGLHFISEEAFHQQIQKAHTEYFEKKANDFFRFYDPELLPATAWKHALIISLWDGLGISHNRKAMQQVAMILLDEEITGNVAETLEIAYSVAGFRSNQSEISWNMKAVRPASHPKLRIEEAVELTHEILNQPFGEFLKPNAAELWDTWFENSPLKKTSRFQILFGTVFLPSLYVLGNLFAYSKLSESALTLWTQLKTPIPASLLSKFNTLNLDDAKYRKKLGAVHQLKSYCNTGSCSECLVLKKAIPS